MKSKTYLKHFATILLIILVASCPLSKIWASPAFGAVLLQNTAPTKDIKGTVVDSNGEPLIGASIIVKGSKISTITNADGEFSLPEVGNGSILEVSYIGFLTKSVRIKDSTPLVIQLKEDASNLDEIVVIGYGNVRREALTGSVSSISGKAVEQVPVSSLAEALGGKLAGVQVTSDDGSPDADIVVRVRGGGSITQDNSPLYLVDGFPVDNLKDISPTDIESIDVLKDASSTAVYGARGANGVINITTKRAKAGKASISFNSYMSLRTLSKKLNVLDPYEFVLVQYENARLKSSQPTSFIEKFGDPSEYHIYKDFKGDDWQDLILGGTTTTQYYNATISGSGQKTQYHLSLTHTNAPGILAGNGQKKTFLNAKLKSEIFPFLTLEYNTRFVNTRTDGSGTEGVSVLSALEYAPTQGLQDFMIMPPASEDFSPEEEDYQTKYNPLDQTAQKWRQKGGTLFNTTVAANLKLFKGLTFRSEFGIDFNYGYQKNFFGPKTGNAEQYSGGMPFIELTKTETPKYRMANTLTYQGNYKKRHHLNVLLGQEINHAQMHTDFLSTRYFPVNITPKAAFDNLTLGEAYKTTSKKNTPERLSSWFGRIMYDYNRRFYATFTLRADGSSKFAPGNRWGIFPAGSVAWRISEEKFLQDTFVSDLKLRFSTGASGNNRIASDLWKSTYALSTSKTPGWNEVINTYYTFGSSYLPNPSLKWETTITNNLGLDFGFFNGRLSGSLDLYLNNTKDLLVPSTIPQTTGFSEQQTNIGETQNKGVELTLNALLVKKQDFTMNANFNIGLNRNKIVSLASGETEWKKGSRWASTDQTPYEDYLVRVGSSVGLMYGYTNDGFYKVEDFDYNTTTRTYTLKEGVVDCSSLVHVMPGAPKFKKLGEVSPDEKNPMVNDSDLSIIGHAMPKFSGGFGLNAEYKNIDFSIFFNYMVGNDVYNGNKMHLTAFWRNNYNASGNLSTLVDRSHRFRFVDDEGNDLRGDPELLASFNENATMWNPTTITSPIMMSYNVEDGSFLRLNTLTLGYTLPMKISRIAHISKLRIYVTGYNLWTWTNYSGYDPEVNILSGLTPGIDSNKYPRSRTYTFGVNLTF